ncbi:MAG TPA: DUF445 family protein [Pyrinomonadaceae bacterium]|nr:DUF445 family protein [Pyrinomonadaceae bacterium]
MEFFNNFGAFFFNNFWQNVSFVLFATLHGYFGAWLAVRMLFRPRHPVKLLGLTVFPQGMIPRHRDKLAVAIGKAVGEELVSQETVLEELFEKDFLRKKIESLIDSYAREILSKDYPTLIEALPAGVREPFLDSVAALQLKIGNHVAGVLKSEETHQSIESFVERRVDEFLSKRVSQAVNEENFNKILGFLETRAHSIVKQKVFEQKIREFVGKRVEDLAHTQTSLGEMITDDAVAILRERAAEQINPIVHQIAEIATSRRTRDQIGALIKREVHNYYENLAFFKKMFVSRENLLKEVDDLVNESLPRRIEETLRGDFFAGEARNFIDAAINNALARPLPEIIGTIAPEKLETFKAQISKNVLSLLQGEEMTNQLSAYLTDTLHKVRPHSLDAILQIVHPEAEEKLKNMLSKGLINVLTTNETANIINTVLSRQIERLLATPIGKLSAHVSEERVLNAGKNLTDTIISAAREKLPQVIREFDLGGVVRDKINNYPVEKLENLVLSVAKEHLRKIELFGALFGLVLGIGQVFVTYLFSR